MIIIIIIIINVFSKWQLFVNMLAYARVPAGSPSRGGDVAVYVFDLNQPSLPTPFYSALVSVSLFVAF